MSHSQVFSLKSHEIDSHWQLLRPLIERVNEITWTPEEIYDLLKRAEAQVWGVWADGVINAIWITQIHSNKSAKWGFVWIAAGNGLEDIVDLYIRHTEPWFKEQGCQMAMIDGRKGWKKALPEYDEVSRTLVKRFH